RFRNKRPQIDFFVPSKIADVILSVEGKKLHVSKQILANVSSYFESLFYGDFKESQKKLIVLGDVSLEDFLTILKLIYDTGVADDDNIESLLMMADRFDIQRVMISAEEWLTDCSHLPLHLKLLLSNQYNLYTLQSECLGLMRKMNNWSVSIVTKSESYKHYSSELKKELDLIESESLDASSSKKTSRIDGANLQSIDDVEFADSEGSGVIRMRVDNVKNLSIVGVRSEVKRING
ncbi:hypothetical protein PENTCL1PPCAC_23543, partial [Pristionchus entomophagus]